MSTTRSHKFSVIAGVVLLGMAIFAIVQVSMIGQPVNVDGLGPRLLPAVVTALFLIFAIGYIVAAWRGRNPDVAASPDEAPRPGGANRTWWLLMGLAGLLLTIQDVGIGVACTLAFALFTRAFGSRRLLADIGVGFAFVLCVWGLFSQVLGVQLGPFFGPHLPLF